MTTSAIPGPLSVTGQDPTLGPGPTPYVGGPAARVDSNPDFAPSLLWMGMGVRDPRYLARIGQGANVAGGYPNQDVGFFFAGAGLLTIDQAPAAKSATNIAASQSVTTGTPLTLAGASTGITVLAAPLTVVSTGNVVPAGCLVIDGTPTYVGSGTSGGFAFMNPANSVSRALVVAVGNVTIHGYDLFGSPITQTLTAATTTKAFKFVRQIVANANGSAVTVGTTDVIGLPIYAAEFAAVSVVFANTVETANTGFVAGVTTAASATTGDTRGTYLLPSASDGTTKLTVYSALNFGVIASSYAAAVAALIGVPQA